MDKLMTLFTPSELANKALQVGDPDLITAVLDKVSEEDLNKIFYHVCEKKNFDLMNTCLTKNLSQDCKNTTLLKVCYNNNNVDIVNFLLDNGADINSIVGNNTTPLIRAINYDQIEIIKLLLDRGADVNKIADGHSPLTSACYRIDEEKDVIIDIIKLLLEKDADVNYQRQYNGFTPLMNIVEYGSEPYLSVAVKLLLEKGVDINIKRKNGRTVKDMIATNLKHLFVEPAKKYYMGICSSVKLTVKFPELQEIRKNSKFYYVFEVPKIDDFTFKLPLNKQAVLTGLTSGKDEILMFYF